MIDNYLLEELVTFAKHGTLAATAEELMVTQPTVTRGMQKLEDDLGVKIFDRQPNRIALTDTGKLAAQEAQKALDANQQFYDSVRKFDFSHRITNIGSVAPGPIILMNNLNNLPDNVKINQTMVKPDNVEETLVNRDCSMVLTNQEFETPGIESLYIGTEKLAANLDKFMAIASLSSVTFDQLKGLSFVVLNDIGIWKDIIQKEIPNAKFMYQEQRDSFSEITKYSNFPYFSTNISTIDLKQDEDDDRVQIPISDESATMDLYATYLKEEKQPLLPLIKEITTAWNKFK